MTKAAGHQKLEQPSHLRQTAHDLANHLLALQLRIRELMMDRECMARPSGKVIQTLDHLASDAMECLRTMQEALDQRDDAAESGTKPKRRRATAKS